MLGMIYRVMCDLCGRRSEERGSFREIDEQARRAGWRVEAERAWHVCPECRPVEVETPPGDQGYRAAARRRAQP